SESSTSTSTTTTTSESPTTTSTTATTSESSTTTSTTLPPRASKCTGKQFDVAGRNVRRRVRCYRKAVRNGSMVEDGCLTAARDRSNAAGTKLESPDNDGRRSLDVSEIENIVDVFTDGLVAALEPSGVQVSRCTGEKMLLAAGKVVSKAKCYRKAATKGVSV